MSELPPSVLAGECLDGPYRGEMHRFGVRATAIEVRDLFDDSKPRAWYRVIDVNGFKELKWMPAAGDRQ